ncbi:MAG: hypothetical protein M1831_004334 [Alyxoria varia]|nr:MAG: hypothetical protein M1831_004334 [Alyxoria varia]
MSSSSSSSSRNSPYTIYTLDNLPKLSTAPAQEYQPAWYILNWKEILISIILLLYTVNQCFTNLSPLFYRLADVLQKPLSRIIPADSTTFNTLTTILERIYDMAMRGQKRMREGTPQGLINPHSQCYQNSILQALSSLPTLRRFLSSLPSDPASTASATSQPQSPKLVKALSYLTSALNDDKTDTRRSLRAPAILRQMATSTQQDAQEYYSKLMDALHKDIHAHVEQLGVARRHPGRTPKPTTLDKASLSVHGDDDETEGDARPTKFARTTTGSVPRNPMEGLLAQRVACTSCGYAEGITLVPTNCLTLSLTGKTPTSIAQCMDRFCELEYLSGVDCERCTLLHARDKQSALLANLESRAHVDATQPHHTTTASTKPTRDATSAVNDPAPRSTHQVALLVKQTRTRLHNITAALTNEDHTKTTLTKHCKIPPHLHKRSTKTKQCVIARPPQCLCLHVNRSEFNVRTGALIKNMSPVEFPGTLDVGLWCVSGRLREAVNGSEFEEGGKVKGGALREDGWEMRPREPMNGVHDSGGGGGGGGDDDDNMKIGNGGTRHPPRYKLRAVVEHGGRHDWGHYTAYRQFLPLALQSTSNTSSTLSSQPSTTNTTSTTPSQPTTTPPTHPNTTAAKGPPLQRSKDTWFALSDETVSPVGEADEGLREVLGGRREVFMLFYERDDEEASVVDESSVGDGKEVRGFATGRVNGEGTVSIDDGKKNVEKAGTTLNGEHEHEHTQEPNEKPNGYGKPTAPLSSTQKPSAPAEEQPSEQPPERPSENPSEQHPLEKVNVEEYLSAIEAEEDEFIGFSDSDADDVGADDIDAPDDEKEEEKEEEWRGFSPPAPSDVSGAVSDADDDTDNNDEGDFNGSVKSKMHSQINGQVTNELTNSQSNGQVTSEINGKTHSDVKSDLNGQVPNETNGHINYPKSTAE